MEKYLRPRRFSADPLSIGAEMEWIHWRTTFENFFNTIQSPHSFCGPQENMKIVDSTKLTLFINHVTPNVYKLFRGIETCEEVITHLNNIYRRSDNNDVSARYKLANKKQQAGESLYAYVQSLRELARDCNFDFVCAEKNREDYIRDVFICGIVSNDIRKKLLENSTLTLEEAVNRAADLELEFQSLNTAELPSNSQESENNQHSNNTNSTIPEISLSSGRLTNSDVIISDNLSRICQDVKNLTMYEPEDLAEELPINSSELSVLSSSCDEDVQQEPEERPSPLDVAEGLKSSDAAVLLKMVKAARIFVREINPQIFIMVKAGVIKSLVRTLDRNDCPDLQFEASSALEEIAGGSYRHTMGVINSGVVPKLVCLASTGGTVGEQCTRALGKIAGAGPEPRDLVLSSGALPAIFHTLRPGVPNSQLRAATWTFRRLCNNYIKPLVNFDMVAPALPYIANLLEVNDENVLSELCWALSYLTDGPNERIEAVQAVPNLLKKLVRLLNHPEPLVKTAALCAVEIMLNGSKEQIDRCLNEGCLNYLSTLLRYNKPGLVVKAASALGQILAGTQPQIQRAIDYGILPHLLHVLMHHDTRCQKEAARAVASLCLGGNPQQLEALLALDFLEPYCNLLDSQDTDTVNYVLWGITNLLQSAKKHGNLKPLCVKFEMIGALSRIKSLQTHENKQICKEVLHILGVYFAGGDDDETA